eukprot:snap_masked-scaffold_6-processed-gene-13.27-mRNA-1 protein AED:1.00 eAED:1.00 QI:0/-1/0/0/-1/1/1/0/274
MRRASNAQLYIFLPGGNFILNWFCGESSIICANNTLFLPGQKIIVQISLANLQPLTFNCAVIGNEQVGDKYELDEAFAFAKTGFTPLASLSEDKRLVSPSVKRNLTSFIEMEKEISNKMSLSGQWNQEQTFTEEDFLFFEEYFNPKPSAIKPEPIVAADESQSFYREEDRKLDPRSKLVKLNKRRWSLESEVILVGRVFDRKFINLSFKAEDWEVVSKGFFDDCKRLRVEDGCLRDKSAVKRHFKVLMEKNLKDDTINFQQMHRMYKKWKSGLN